MESALSLKRIVSVKAESSNVVKVLSVTTGASLTGSTVIKIVSGRQVLFTVSQTSKMAVSGPL